MPLLLSVLFACLLSTASLFSAKPQEKKTTTINEDSLLPRNPVKKDVLLPPQMVQLERFLAGPEICDGKKNDKSTLKLQIIALLSADYCMWSTLYPLKSTAWSVIFVGSRGSEAELGDVRGHLTELGSFLSIPWFSFGFPYRCLYIHRHT